MLLGPMTCHPKCGMANHSAAFLRSLAVITRSMLVVVDVDLSSGSGRCYLG